MPHLPTADVACPYCGETITLVVDDSAGDQRYVEDCHVCCKPIEVRVSVDDDGRVDVSAWGRTTPEGRSRVDAAFAPACLGCAHSPARGVP